MKKNKKFIDLQVIILAGGKGTRLSEYTNQIPKPMVKLNNKPIIEYIINFYKSYGLKNFLIATGYKSKIIENYFKKKKLKNNIKVINTGLNTLTGLRIYKLKKFIKSENFFLTYGDGLCNVNLDRLYEFHIKKNKIATVTAVHPPARFGELFLKKNLCVRNFEEKNQLKTGWINGGFFIFQKKFFKFLNKNNVMLERQPMQKLVKKNQLAAFKHSGFWACMDNMRDKINLEKVIKNKKIKLRK